MRARRLRGLMRGRAAPAAVSEAERATAAAKRRRGEVEAAKHVRSRRRARLELEAAISAERVAEVYDAGGALGSGLRARTDLPANTVVAQFAAALRVGRDDAAYRAAAGAVCRARAMPLDSVVAINRVLYVDAASHAWRAPGSRPHWYNMNHGEGREDNVRWHLVDGVPTASTRRAVSRGEALCFDYGDVPDEWRLSGPVERAHS